MTIVRSKKVYSVSFWLFYQFEAPISDSLRQVYLVRHVYFRFGEASIFGEACIFQIVILERLDHAES